MPDVDLTPAPFAVTLPDGTVAGDPTDLPDGFAELATQALDDPPATPDPIDLTQLLS